MPKTDTLTVRNIEQAAAWLELDGQISDGHWENASPDDHWRVWCNAEVRIAYGDEQLGRDFYARKDNYNLTSKALLDVIGKRMLGTVRIARRFGLAIAKLLEGHVNLDGFVDFDGHGMDYEHGTEADRLHGEYWDRKRATLTAFNRDEIDMACASNSYSMKDLTADLRDLKAIMKVKR